MREGGREGCLVVVPVRGRGRLQHSQWERWCVLQPVHTHTAHNTHGAMDGMNRATKKSYFCGLSGDNSSWLADGSHAEDAEGQTPCV